MNFRKLLVGALSFGFFLMVAACATHPTVSSDRPDLIPELRSGTGGPEGYCRKNDKELVVKVLNQSTTGTDKASKTEVKFSNGPIGKKLTGPLAGGASEEVNFPMPQSCFNPDCHFKIMVDADNDIEESPVEAPDNHEFNNNAEGVCPG